MQAAKEDAAQFRLNRKRVLSQSTTAAATLSAVIVGAVPVPIPDATILGPVEIAAITAISKIYGIDKEHGAERFKETIAEVGTVSLAAKGVLSLTKAIPGLNLATSVANAWLPEASLQHYVGLQSMLASRFILAIRAPTMPTG